MSKNLVFVKAYCGSTKQPYYIRYDKAADGAWVESYGLKELPPADASSFSGSNAIGIDVSSARTGPQFKCPWCGNRSYWKHSSDPNCQSVNCWDGKTMSNLPCGKCGKLCSLGTSTIQTLDGSGGRGQ